MSFSPIAPWEIGVGRPITHGLWDRVRRNFDDHQARFAMLEGGEQVFNGSFEMDANNDGIPDGWTRGLYPGGAGGFETATAAHGGRVYVFTHPGGAGNGGGFLESDFIEIDQLTRRLLRFVHWSPAVGLRNIVQITYFNWARVAITTVNIYDSTASPAAPTCFFRTIPLIANARFIRIRLIGGFPGAPAGGTALFDAVSFGNMPHWRVRRDFTIPEHSTTSTAWVDAGSVDYNLEFNSNIPIDFRFWAELRTSHGADVFQRFRVGSVFSNEAHVFASTVLSEFRFPLFILSNLTMSPIMTIVQQLRATGVGVTAFGRKPPEGLFQPTTCEYAIL